MERRLGFVAVQPRNGTVTIPAEARRELGLDRPGAQVEVLIRDGAIVLIPHMAVPTDQTWFFSAGHQAAEREAEADLEAGRYRDFGDADALLDHLEHIAPAGQE